MARQRIQFEDWIPYKRGLARSIEVAKISTATGIDRHGVVGRLMEFWDWASAHTPDGYLLDVTVYDVEAATDIGVNFLAAVSEATGWIAIEKRGIRLRNADRWITGGARARLLEKISARDRKRKERDITRDIGVTLPVTCHAENRDQSVTALYSTSSSESLSSSSIQAEEIGKSSKVKSSKRCPAEFELNQDRMAFALANGLDSGQAEFEFAKMVDHQFGTARSDWDAVWRNWVRTSVDRRRGPVSGGFLTAAEKTAAAVERVLRRSSDGKI